MIFMIFTICKSRSETRRLKQILDAKEQWIEKSQLEKAMIEIDEQDQKEE